MGKGKRMRETRRAQQQPVTPAIDPSMLAGWADNPYADKMLPTYIETTEWGNKNPDLGVRLAETTEQEAGEFAAIIKTLDGLGEESRGAALLLQRWAILNQIMFLYNWEVPVAAMTIDEIITAVREDPTI